MKTRNLEILRSEGEYALILDHDSHYTPYIVTWKLDPDSMEWGQGHYFETRREALAYYRYAITPPWVSPVSGLEYRVTIRETRSNDFIVELYTSAEEMEASLKRFAARALREGTAGHFQITATVNVAP